MHHTIKMMKKIWLSQKPKFLFARHSLLIGEVVDMIMEAETGRFDEAIAGFHTY